MKILTKRAVKSYRAEIKRIQVERTVHYSDATLIVYLF